MTNRLIRNYAASGIVLLSVALAYIFRLIGRGSFYPTLFSYLRSFIYIGVYAAWGLSVRQRIVQKQVRRYLDGNTHQPRHPLYKKRRIDGVR